MAIQQKRVVKMTEKIQKQLRSLLRIFTLGLVLLFLFAAYFFTTKDTVQQSIWSLFPPLIAIALALVTKEVYSSLFLGILSGALLFSGYNFCLYSCRFSEKPLATALCGDDSALCDSDGN